MTSQQQEALELANQVRMANANTCRELRALPPQDSATRAAELLRDFPPALGALRIDVLVQSVPGIGVTKAMDLLGGAGVSRIARRIRELSPRQREDLACRLVAWGYDRRSPRRRVAA